MAHFYGKLHGNRGEATRLGTKASGITTWAASWKGAVRVSLYVNKDGQDMALVELREWRGQGSDRIIYQGPVNGREAQP